MKDETKHILGEVVEILSEYALEAKKEFEKNKQTKESEFYRGILIGYYRVLSTIKGQLEGFQVNLKDIGFNIDQEKDLLSGVEPKKTASQRK
ncbi:hypothetical protein HYW21_00975 [Candidatus Woesearchaeota archaeon]|nr:hypothetical protein [Candidatus Woesearchaeota archaeon]